MADPDCFDRENRLTIKDLDALIMLRTSGVWSDKYEQFSKPAGAVSHLQAALSDLVAKNR